MDCPDDDEEEEVDRITNRIKWMCEKREERRESIDVPPSIDQRLNIREERLSITLLISTRVSLCPALRHTSSYGACVRRVRRESNERLVNGR